MKKFFIIALLTLNILYLSAEKLNIHNLFSLDIPDSFEVISVGQSLQKHKKSEQYCLRIYIEVIYENRYLPMNLYLYGNDKYDELHSMFQLDEISTFYNEYHRAVENYFLKNKGDTEEINVTGLSYSRMVSDWASGVMSDYYGVYFQLANNYFEEAFVTVTNSWYSFTDEKLKSYDSEFRDKIANMDSIGQDYYDFIDTMIQNLALNGDFEINEDFEYMNYEYVSGYYIPTVENLRLRSSPDLNAQILGYVTDEPHKIIGFGDDFTAGGIEGKWLRIRTFTGTTTGWAFSGFIREIRKDEEIKYFEGY